MLKSLWLRMPKSSSVTRLSGSRRISSLSVGLINTSTQRFSSTGFLLFLFVCYTLFIYFLANFLGLIPADGSFGYQKPKAVTKFWSFCLQQFLAFKITRTLGNVVFSFNRLVSSAVAGEFFKNNFVQGGTIFTCRFCCIPIFFFHCLKNVFQIHWFSIFNSFMMVIFLVGLVWMILVRTLKKDYARYQKDEDLDDMVYFVDICVVQITVLLAGASGLPSELSMARRQNLYCLCKVPSVMGCCVYSFWFPMENWLLVGTSDHFERFFSILHHFRFADFKKHLFVEW